MDEHRLFMDYLKKSCRKRRHVEQIISGVVLGELLGKTLEKEYDNLQIIRRVRNHLPTISRR